MGLTNRKGGDPTVSVAPQTSPNRYEKHAADQGSSHGSDGRPKAGDFVDHSTRLHRGLKARQVTMIAIGGAMYVLLIFDRGLR